mgnify:FL=1
MALFASRASSFTTRLTELADGNQRGALISRTIGVGQVGTGVGGALAGTAYAATGYPTSAVAAGVLIGRTRPDETAAEQTDEDDASDDKWEGKTRHGGHAMGGRRRQQEADTECGGGRTSGDRTHFHGFGTRSACISAPTSIRQSERGSATQSRT